MREFIMRPFLYFFCMRGQDKLRTIPVVLTSQHAEAERTGRYLIGHSCGGNMPSDAIL